MKTPIPIDRPDMIDRHEIYKLAKIYYNEYRSIAGLCSSLTHAYIKYYNVDIADLKDYFMELHFSANVYFPEFVDQKPITKLLFWFPLREIDKRIEILDKIIELTKPES